MPKLGKVSLVNAHGLPVKLTLNRHQHLKKKSETIFSLSSLSKKLESLRNKPRAVTSHLSTSLNIHFVPFQ